MEFHSAAHDGQKGYAAHGKYYGSPFELSIGSQARQEAGTPRGDQVHVRLKEKWGTEYEARSGRDLSNEEYVYDWADGVLQNAA